MHVFTLSLAALLVMAMPIAAYAQGAITPLYRVFLADGTALASYGEWARVDDRVIFSMPLTPAASAAELHLVSLPVGRVDLPRTERYADSVRASHYAAGRGEVDFAQLTSDVAHALNQVALIPDPVQRLAAAEKARRALADWPGAHHGYRAAEVAEIVGVLDGVIGGLRASAGLGSFDLALTSSTPPPAPDVMLPAPDHAALVEHLMTAATAVDSPVEKVSLLQSVIGALDRAVGLLPDSIAAAIRSAALGGIAEETAIDASYAQLRTAALTDAAALTARADVRAIERLAARLRDGDRRLGHKRPDDIAAVIATLDAHLASAHRLRLVHDQWLIRVAAVRAYKRTSAALVQTLTHAHEGLDDIRALAGPSPERLRVLARQLSRAGRRLAIINAPPEVSAVHAVFRSAFELAENAVQLRLDAAAAADVDLARQASSAASGALMLLARARLDLDAALQPPISARALPRP
ncbi:MAG TPA: hypothetical protein VNJ02_14805 [Vicinamibacterales bacterium]|nr:hypothetical protein [Vicinamibacterales bacterium]